MAGFLEKENTIIDMIITSEGKSLLSKGKLKFVYFSLFDDEVDYNPYIANSGSLSESSLSSSIDEQIEASLVREAVSGYKFGINNMGYDYTNVKSPLFSVKQGSQYLPELSSSDDPNVNITLRAKQTKIQSVNDSYANFGRENFIRDIGYLRSTPTSEDLTFFYTSNDVINELDVQDGILIRVYRSGSGGYVEVDENRDSNNDLVFGNDLVINTRKK